MGHWSEILKKAAARARAGERVEIPVTEVRDRAFAVCEAKGYPDLEIAHDQHLGVLVLRKRVPEP
jgi:hypothetical protein